MTAWAAVVVDDRGDLRVHAPVRGGCDTAVTQKVLPDVGAVEVRASFGGGDVGGGGGGGDVGSGQVRGFGEVVLHGEWPHPLAENWSIGLSGDPCTWNELLYGFVRFVHAEAHCLHDRLVMDAATVVCGGRAVLVIGSGKSHWAASLHGAGWSVASDDTSLIIADRGVVTAFGRPPEFVRSRTGASCRQSPGLPLRAARLRAVVHVQGGYGVASVRPAGETDAWSWLLAASVGRLANARAWPRSLKEMYVCDPRRLRAVARLARKLCHLPLYDARGRVPVEAFIEAVKE